MSAANSDAARQFWTFLLVGGVAAFVNWSSRIVISAQGVSFEIAVLIAYLLGMVTAYSLSRVFVFKKTGRSMAGEMLRFTLVNLVALVLVWLVSVLLESWALPAIGWTWRPAEIAHGVGIISPVLFSYVGHRYFTFSASRFRPETAGDDRASGGKQQ